MTWLCSQFRCIEYPVRFLSLSLQVSASSRTGQMATGFGFFVFLGFFPPPEAFGNFVISL